MGACLRLFGVSSAEFAVRSPLNKKGYVREYIGVTHEESGVPYNMNVNKIGYYVTLM